MVRSSQPPGLKSLKRWPHKSGSERTHLVMLGRIFVWMCLCLCLSLRQRRPPLVLDRAVHICSLRKPHRSSESRLGGLACLTKMRNNVGLVWLQFGLDDQSSSRSLLAFSQPGIHPKARVSLRWDGGSHGGGAAAAGSHRRGATCRSGTGRKHIIAVKGGLSRMAGNTRWLHCLRPTRRPTTTHTHRHRHRHRRPAD